jgi:hypothetical protein
MSMMDLSGVDFSQISTDLAAQFGSTGTDVAGTDSPAGSFMPPMAFDQGQPWNHITRPDLVNEDAAVTKPDETPEEKAARLANEREDAQAETERLNRRKDARSSMNAVLANYGLSDLADYVYNEIIVKETVNLNNPDAIIFAIREQPAYQKRFSANKERVKNGFDELDPASYIALEDQYRATLSANGMPVSFYDSKDDFDAMIGGSVSNAELQSRIQDGYRAVQDADPEVKRQMRELYGVAEGDLAAYFIDPNRMKPLLVAADYKRQAEAAKIAARGVELAGIQLTGGLAEDLARRGITEGQAQAGFTEIGKLGELTTQLSGEAALSQEQIIGQQFGADTKAAQELEKRRRRRVGEFAGGGGFARTQGETSGAITTAVGTAQ